MAQDGINWPSAENAAATILLGHWYSNIRLHLVARVATLTFIAALISLFGLYEMANNETQYRYLLVDDVGKMVKQVPLEQPNQTDDHVVAWAIDSVTRLFTYDFANYRGQFQDAKANMTAQGWANFEKTMEVAGALKTVVGLRAVTTAVPTGPGTVIKQGPFPWPDGVTRYAWRVRFPMVISYRSSMKGEDGQPIQLTQSVTADVTVMRIPEYLNQAGVGLRQLVLVGK